MQQNDRYNELAQKWLEGTITEEEKKEFSDWYNTGQDDPLNVSSTFASSEKELQQRMLRSINQRIAGKDKIVFIRKHRALITAAASLIIVFCSVAVYYNLSQKNQSSAAVVRTIKTIEPDLSPGSNKATLVLSDGSKLILDSAIDGTIANDKNISIVKLNDGQLAYSILKGKQIEAVYNTLSTPRGGQYAITLSDGTKVWLNSASSLRFPTVFTGNERLVDLTGEAYFEVAKNTSQPFKVKVNDMEVRVLGTHFNVMAYEDEASVKTTLLEGSVNIQNKDAMALLSPGQQAQLNKDGNISVVKSVNTDQVISWKNGLFNFKGTNIEAIMRQLARWYHIDVKYDGKVPYHFNGTISKNVGIDKVFKMLELTGVVHFTIEGNKIIVRP